MSRSTGPPQSSAPAAGERPEPGEQEWWGQRLGLPESGPDSVAGFGPRLGAYGVDSVLANLLALGFTGPLEDAWGLAVLGALALQYLVFVGVFGQTVGMRLLGLRVAPIAAGGASPRVPGLGRTAVRTALLFLLLPALVWDADNRGYHDKLAGTAVLRTR